MQLAFTVNIWPDCSSGQFSSIFSAHIWIQALVLPWLSCLLHGNEDASTWRGIWSQSKWKSSVCRKLMVTSAGQTDCWWTVEARTDGWTDRQPLWLHGSPLRVTAIITNTPGPDLQQRLSSLFAACLRVQPIFCPAVRTLEEAERGYCVISFSPSSPAGSAIFQTTALAWLLLEWKTEPTRVNTINSFSQSARFVI